MMGEYLFEQGEFSGQHGVEISSGELLLREPRMAGSFHYPTETYEWTQPDPSSPGFRSRAQEDPLQGGDSFLLFRFDHSILFDDLFHLSGIPEEEFYRLIYLFHCAGIVGITGLQQQKKAVRPAPPPAEVKPLPGQDAGVCCHQRQSTGSGVENAC